MSWTRRKLIPGEEYLFTHKRRKTFRARYQRIVRAPASDHADEYYIECEAIDPAPVSMGDIGGQSGTMMVLRPSMITVVQDVPADYAPPRFSRSRPESSPSRSKRWTLGRLLRVLRTA